MFKLSRVSKLSQVIIFYAAIIILIIPSVSDITISAQQPVKINQAGYYPDSEKIAVIPADSSAPFFLVGLESDSIVYRGKTGEARVWPHSGETVALADFSEFRTPGSYRIVQLGAGASYPFRIGDRVYRDLSKASIKALYFNRASTELKESHAGTWARPAGHPDTLVYIHRSAASEHRPEGTVISSPKGWYDAGDYNKYIVNSGISTYTMLAAWEHFPEYYENLNLNIPESGNGIADLLNETRWNLDWMITMQDPQDGGVYHKLTTLNFEGAVMPHEAINRRYVVMKSTAATLNFAAVMATSYRVFREIDATFARECLDAAKMAWEWAQENPDVLYRQPDDVFTGAYGDRNVQDEFGWAAAELYISTGDDQYWNAGNFGGSSAGIPGWNYVSPLAWVSLAHHIDSLTPAADKPLIRQMITNQADTLYQEYFNSAYRTSMGLYGQRDFSWGSNGVAGNQSLMLIQAYRLTRDSRYLDAARANLDYIMGRNATGYSFVTGAGSYPPMHPHHRQSQADDIDDPVPGFVVGGPYNGHQDNCTWYPSDKPALSFRDHWCSYTTNEVTINWNAPLIYMTGAIEFYSTENSTQINDE
jgi:endoglucanase